MRIIFLILVSTLVQAQTECLIDMEPVSLATDPSTKLNSASCSKGMSSAAIKDKLSKKSLATAECKTCKDPFGDLTRQTDTGKLERKRRFIVQSMDELKKNISSVAMDAFKVRSVHNLNLSADVQKSCDFSSLHKGKCSKILSERSVELFKKELANEFAFILKGANKKPALFIHETHGCISDADATLATSKLAESSFTPELIRWLKSQYDETGNLDISKLPTSAHTNLLNTSINNPIIKSILTDSAMTKKFFSSITGNENQTSLLSHINSNAAEYLGTSIKNRCTDSIQAIESICDSESFKNGDVALDEPNYIFDGYNDDSEDSREDEYKLLCFELNNASDKTLRFSSELKKLSAGMEKKYKSLPFSKYRSEYYEQNIDEYRNAICSGNAQDCVGKEDNNCKLINTWETIKLERKKDSDLGKKPFSDQSINNLLSSMVGDPTNLDPNVRKVLVAERIIQDGTVPEPKHDPSHDPTPANIARDPVYKAGNPNFKSVAGSGVVKQQVADAKTTPTTVQNQQVIMPTNQTNQSSGEVPDPTDDQDRGVATTQTVKQALQDPFNQKLLDRLMKGRQQPTFTRDEVNKIVRQQLAEQNSNIPNFSPTTQQVEAGTDKFYDDAFNSKFGAASANFKNGAGTSISRDKLSSYDRALAESLRSKYAADEAANKPTQKPSSLGEKKEVKIDAGVVFELDAKLTEKTKDLMEKEGQNFTLVINIGGKLYEFDVRDLVASPKNKSGQPYDPAIVKKVNDFFAKIPRERQNRLRFLNAILAVK